MFRVNNKTRLAASVWASFFMVFYQAAYYQTLGLHDMLLTAFFCHLITVQQLFFSKERCFSCLFPFNDWLWNYYFFLYDCLEPVLWLGVCNGVYWEMLFSDDFWVCTEVWAYKKPNVTSSAFKLQTKQSFMCFHSRKRSLCFSEALRVVLHWMIKTVL